MAEYDSAPNTTRLLEVTLATHDAFTEAARAVRAPGYAAEFAQRAEYHGRLATHLRGLSAPEGMASDAMRRMPEVAPRTPAPGERDPRVLYDECLRVMDAATLEFCRWYGPHVALVLSNAMRVAYLVNTTRKGGITS
jgi:hypothetical protein